LKATNLSRQPLLLKSVVLATVLMTAGCSSMLPKSQSQSPTFQTFDEARQAIESLVPKKSNVETLSEAGLTPAKQPNTLILTQADVVPASTLGMRAGAGSST
jgi:uncharacterized lipoprotein